jgi:hypothetical protein
MKHVIVALLLSINLFSQDITSNLVICMPLDGNATDISGNNNHGAMSSVLSAADRFGNANGAVKFSGNPSQIVVAPSASINNLEVIDELTITSWCKITSFSPTNCFPVANKYNVSNDWGWDYTIQPSATWNGQILVPDYQGMGSSYAICRGNEGVALNQWDFYAITFSKSTSTFKVYKNTTLITTVNTGTFGLQATGTGSLYIGCSPASTMDYANGFMDDFKMYGRALTQAEILAIYNGGSCVVNSINENSVSHKLCSISPNPTLSQLNVSLNLAEVEDREFTVEVYSADGKLVKEQKFQKIDSDNFVIDINNLESGIYFLKFSTGTYHQNLKFIKE